MTMKQVSKNDFVSLPLHLYLSNKMLTMQSNDDRRLETFITTSMPVVEYYKTQDKVIDVRPFLSHNKLILKSSFQIIKKKKQIDSSKPIAEVYADIVKGVERVLPPSTPVESEVFINNVRTYTIEY